ncbi:hypothetical protein [Achromobacter sp. Marseille-Q4962]|uniref:hypothetical protein n=1 Tax=Achromobacter sp. Marseille-Q4962 TaxID=2942202 RepID=UPI002073CCCA|nr:hypothetical protein [Achromobacter sp. Marseille-Q4962]
MSKEKSHLDVFEGRPKAQKAYNVFMGIGVTSVLAMVGGAAAYTYLTATTGNLPGFGNFIGDLALAGGIGGFVAAIGSGLSLKNFKSRVFGTDGGLELYENTKLQESDKEIINSDPGTKFAVRSFLTMAAASGLAAIAGVGMLINAQVSGMANSATTLPGFAAATLGTALGLYAFDLPPDLVRHRHRVQG